MQGSDVAAASEVRHRGMEWESEGGVGTRRGARARIALGTLAALDAAAFLVASVVHFGIGIHLGFTTLADVTILPAGIVEGAIGIALALAAGAVVARRAWAWNATLAAFLFGVLGVLVGLSISLRDSGDSSPANLLFHELVLPFLIAGVVVLLTRSGRFGLGKRPTAREGGP